MQSIKVNKAKLISTLEENRIRHRQIFLEACDGYQKAVIKELEAQLKRAKGGIRRSMLISIAAPVDQTKEYDRAIGMLKMSIEDEVMLSDLEQWRNQLPRCHSALATQDQSFQDR